MCLGFAIWMIDGVIEFLKAYGGERAAQEKTTYGGEKTVEVIEARQETIAKQAAKDFLELKKKELLGERGIGRNPYWLKMVVESGLYTPNRGTLFRHFAEELI